jgi:hypothetical protein
MNKSGDSPQKFMTNGQGKMGKNDHVIFRSKCPRCEGLKQNRA